MDDEGWDLQAVVRGCRITSATTATATTATVNQLASFSPSTVKEELVVGDGSLTFSTSFVPELYGSRSGSEELCKASICESKPEAAVLLPLQPNCSKSPSSAMVTAVIPPSLAGVQQPQFQPRQQQRPASHMSRSMRRKNQQKRVVSHVPADGLSADVWAWRKYGQKPIKGSPYPRGYYRCSSSKGCLARKQVERSRTDPGTFIITYTAEHNHPAPTHRNSLAGSTRTKFPSSSASTAVGSTAVTGGLEQAPSSPFSSPPIASVLSPTTPLTSFIEDELLGRRSSSTQKANDGGSAEEDEEDVDGMLVVEDMEVMGQHDLVFMGLDEISGGSSNGEGGASSDLFNGSGFDENMFAPPWLANNNSNNTAAAAGGR